MALWIKHVSFHQTQAQFLNLVVYIVLHMTSVFPLHLEMAHIPTLCILLQSMFDFINFLKTIKPLLLISLVFHCLRLYRKP